MQALKSAPTCGSLGLKKSLTRSFELHGCTSQALQGKAVLVPEPAKQQEHAQRQRSARISACADPFAELELRQLGASLGQRVRVRQHVNPMKLSLQTLPEPTQWELHYSDPQLPLLLDIGAGAGRFLLSYSRRMPHLNMLGLEIREPLVERANTWAKLCQAEHHVHFAVANATVSLVALLAGALPYPGPISMVTLQFPDPHFKSKHHKRRVVQPALVEALVSLLPAGARILLQSDVLEVASDMRDHFERHGASYFQPVVSEHCEGAVFSADYCESRPQALKRKVVNSVWAEAGWLKENPLGTQTEREVMVMQQGLPVYRMLLEKKHQTCS